MELEVFKKIARFPFYCSGEFFDSKVLPQNKTCQKCSRLECKDFSKYNSNEFICFKGFNNILVQLKTEKAVLNGLILSDNKVVKQGTRDARGEFEFDRKIVQNYIDEVNQISECIDEGIKSNIKERFSLFHDVRSSYAIAFSNIEKIILKSEGHTYSEKLQNSEQGIIDLYDSLDLVNSQLELIDVMVNPSAIVQGLKRTMNFFKLIDKLRKLFTPKSEKRDLVIHVYSNHQIPDGSYHDSIKLIPIILIENAIKYSDESHQIHITFHEEKNEKVSFTVSSYGAIVDTDEREAIFGKHVRGRNTRFYKTEGIGMGLFIAKNILAKHNGSIEYSAEEKGRGNGFNKFTVTV
jgi:K+-sensing histidine kinase KdpD